MACERDLEGSVRPRAANACSTVRGIDSLDYAEVVADRPVLGQVIALDGEDVQLRPGDLRAARRPVSEPGHTAADMDVPCKVTQTASRPSSRVPQPCSSALR